MEKTILLKAQLFTQNLLLIICEKYFVLLKLPD
jgi:hypothetical protein